MLNLETRECVEYCSPTELFGGVCSLNNTVGFYNIFDNPFALRYKYDYINSSVSIKEIISNQFIEYIAKIYNVDINVVKNQINNYLGNGQIYNLPKSQVIIGNNVTIELSSVKLELDKLQKIKSGEQPANVSALDLSACQDVLKNAFSLPSEEDLLILKGDILSELSEYYSGNKVEYELF